MTESPGLRVRRAGPDDLDAFVAVVSEVAAERRYIATEPEDVDPERARWILAPDSPDAAWMLEDGGRPIGIAGLHPAGHAGVSSLGMAIVSEARGRGGATALLRALLDHARAEGLAKVVLEAFTDNAPAIALYARHGFELEGVRRRHYLRRDGTRRDVVLMGMLLD